MNLEHTAISVIEQFPNEASAGLRKQERLLEKFGNIAFGGFGIVILVAICAMIFVIFTKMILNGSQPFGGIMLTAFILFAVASVGYVLWNQILEDKRSKILATAVRDPDLAKSTGELLPDADFEPIASVTENTTKLLEIKRDTM